MGSSPGAAAGIPPDPSGPARTRNSSQHVINGSVRGSDASWLTRAPSRTYPLLARNRGDRRLSRHPFHRRPGREHGALLPAGQEGEVLAGEVVRAFRRVQDRVEVAALRLRPLGPGAARAGHARPGYGDGVRDLARIALVQGFAVRGGPRGALGRPAGGEAERRPRVPDIAADQDAAVGAAEAVAR